MGERQSQEGEGRSYVWEEILQGKDQYVLKKDPRDAFCSLRAFGRRGNGFMVLQNEVGRT